MARLFRIFANVLHRPAVTGGLIAALTAFSCHALDAEFIDVANGEDLVALPNSPWILASSMASPSNPGGIYAINSHDHRVYHLYPPEGDVPVTESAENSPCPSPPGRLAPHGLSLARTDNGDVMLYAVNHEGRESIEIFSVRQNDKQAKPPSLAWRDCLPMPEGASANSVTAGATGVVYATVAGPYFDLPSRIEPFPSSGVIALKPGGSWYTLAAFDNRLTNGIAMSADNKRVFVADWYQGSVLVLDTDNPGNPVATIELGFLVDNLRLGDEGSLWAGGHIANHGDVMRCYNSDARQCAQPFGIARIDPESLEVYCQDRLPALEQFDTATVALANGGRLWLGTVRGRHLMVLHRAEEGDTCVAP